MATLTVATSHNYENDVLNNISAITFTASAQATFSSAQFGGGHISNSVAVTGDPSVEAIAVEVASGATFSAANWTFANWNVGATDYVYFNGTSGNETITGSSQND